MRGFFDNVRLAFGTFAAHPLRSLLTLLGIVIGVATVVTMMALIEGLRLKVNRDLSQLGANVFRVDKWPVGIHMGGGFNWNKYAKRPSLTLDDKRAIAEHCPSVQTVSASNGQPAQKVTTPSGAETQPSVWINGVTAEYVDTAGITVDSGRFLSDADDVEGRPVAVIGHDVADRLFPSTEPLGQEIRLKNRPFTVVGVLEKRGTVLGLFSLDNIVVLPMQSFLPLYGKGRSISLNVQAKDAESLEKAQEEVTRLLRQRRRVAPSAESDFELATNESMTKTLNQLSTVITAAAFGVCLLSLLVGGIGILN